MLLPDSNDYYRATGRTVFEALTDTPVEIRAIGQWFPLRDYPRSSTFFIRTMRGIHGRNVMFWANLDGEPVDQSGNVFERRELVRQSQLASFMILDEIRSRFGLSNLPNMRQNNPAWIAERIKRRRAREHVCKCGRTMLDVRKAVGGMCPGGCGRRVI